MLLDFLSQLSLALLFIVGLTGIGVAILNVLKIPQKNISLTVSSAFFVSLCLYTAGSVFLLFLIPNPKKVLAIYSIVYGLASATVLLRVVYLKRSVFIKKEFLLRYLKKNWVIFASVFFVVVVFFLGIYKTALLDEWLHRPVINFFLTNNEFPLKSPYTPGITFTSQYHYGLDIVGAAIAVVTKNAVSESLDIMKISFVIASYLLFFGMLFEWSKKKVFSATGAILLLLSGASFFFLDGYSTNHWFAWGEQFRTMNYPLLYSLMGITWVNIPLSVAFMILLEELFYTRSDYRLRVISMLSLLFAGMYLISELFAVVLILVAVILFLYNVYRKRITSVQILLSLGIFLAMTVGIYFSQGVIFNIIKTMDFSKLVTIRPFFSWGYPSEVAIISPFQHGFFYLRNFLLEIIIIILLVLAFIKKKIKVSENPSMFFLIIITFLIPFIVDTSFVDINLYKITAFGILLLHLLIFYYLAKNFEIKIYTVLMILFLFGSLPVIVVNYNIFTKSTETGKAIGCVQNTICDEKDAVTVLHRLQAYDPGIKYVFASSQNDMERVVDLSNSYVMNYTSDFERQGLNPEYVYVSPESIKKLSQQQLVFLQSLKKIAEKGEYAVYVIY